MMKSPADFDSMITNIRELHANGRIEECIENAQLAKALITQVKFPENLNAAINQNYLGMIFFETGYLRDALEVYESSLALLKKLGTPKEEQLASLYNNLGQVHQHLGNLKHAKSFLQEALSIREKESPDTLAHGYVLDNLGAVCYGLGDHSSAESMHERALAIFEHLLGSINTHVATALGNLSNIYLSQRDFRRAESSRLRALDTHVRSSGMQATGTLIDIRMMAEIYLEKGNQGRADYYVNLLLSLVSNTPRKDQRYLAEMLMSLMRSAFNDFRLDIAERVGTKVVTILEAVLGNQAPESLEAIVLLANVMRAQNSLEPARKYYQRALSAYEQLEMKEEAATVMLELGKIYRDRASYPIALEMFQSAIKILQETAQEDKARMASALGNLAQLYYEEDKYDLADKTYAKALAEIRDDDNPERPWLLHNRAMLKYHLGDYESSRILYEDAKRLWIEMHGENHPFVATAVANIALVLWATGDQDQAVDRFLEAETLREEQMQRILAIGSEAKRTAYARSLLDDLNKVVSLCVVSVPCAASLSRFAGQMLLRRKGRILDALGQTFSLIRENITANDQVIFNRLQVVRKQISDLITPMLVRKGSPQEPGRLRKLRQEEEKLEAELSYRGALHRPGLQEVFLEEVRNEIPDGGMLVDFVRFSVFEPKRTGEKQAWSGSHYAAMVLLRVGDIKWYDLGDAAAIDEQADKLLAILRNDKSTQEEWQTEAANLYKLILAPLETCLHETHHLLISPDGKLALVPFIALIDQKGNQLGSRMLVSYVTSGRELAALPSYQSRSKEVVVVADPNFDEDSQPLSSPEAPRFASRGKFSPLPGAREEGRQIENLLDGVTILTGSGATVDAVKSVSAPAVLHIATHGIFSPMESGGLKWHQELLSIGEEILFVNQASPDDLANPMFFSGVALAGANKRNVAGNVGIFTAQEMAGLDLHGTELVVLSACETGLGTVKLGEEFTGLRRALGIAGAATQVTSLWKVSDRATSVLMGHYYRLLVEGHGRAEALAMAQKCIENDAENTQWKHPYYWAAFVSSGSWKPMTDALKPKRHPTK